MKLIGSSIFIICLLFVAGCQKKSQGKGGQSHEETEISPNQALYDEVMDIHNEVMPKLDDLYKAKIKLSARIKESPGLSESEKNEIRQKIARLDSASESMMVWMRQFNPLPDSLGEEKAKAYLDRELEKVKAVRQNILQALKDSDSVN